VSGIASIEVAGWLPAVPAIQGGRESLVDERQRDPVLIQDLARRVHEEPSEGDEQKRQERGGYPDPREGGVFLEHTDPEQQQGKDEEGDVGPPERSDSPKGEIRHRDERVNAPRSEEGRDQEREDAEEQEDPRPAWSVGDPDRGESVRAKASLRAHAW